MSFSSSQSADTPSLTRCVPIIIVRDIQPRCRPHCCAAVAASEQQAGADVAGGRVWSKKLCSEGRSGRIALCLEGRDMLAVLVAI